LLQDGAISQDDDIEDWFSAKTDREEKQTIDNISNWTLQKIPTYLDNLWIQEQCDMSLFGLQEMETANFEDLYKTVQKFSPDSQYFSWEMDGIKFDITIKENEIIYQKWDIQRSLKKKNNVTFVFKQKWKDKIILDPSDSESKKVLDNLINSATQRIINLQNKKVNTIDIDAITHQMHLDDAVEELIAVWEISQADTYLENELNDLV